ncbi:MAG: ATP-dependent helicase [Desulfurococcales archaeon]|nr:ATP-dependent helicase [Desulfurococcales archaeon]
MQRALLSDDYTLEKLQPFTREWFKRKYSSLTLPQRLAIPLIKEGHNVLISSPTGTGKTLAAFTAIIDELFKLSLSGSLEDKIYAIYVSPLRALNNDMYRNLIVPIKEIAEIARESGYDIDEIRVMVRTSDTPSTVKQKMVRKPPHILITTPESLSIALVAPKFRERLATARWIIVDEIHEVASSKRGSHLALSIERLDYLVEEKGGRLQRIGMSATIAPLDEVARFLAGYKDDGTPREVKIVDARFAKPIDIRVLTPKVDLINDPANVVNDAIYRLLIDLVKQHRTTLVFTNTRSATERVVYKLRSILGNEGLFDADMIEAHHSSLSRRVRLEVEEKLKRGELKVVVSSTSLELGIDIGYIDLVVLLSSPKSVSRLLQRIGRAGHHIKAVSKGRIIVVDRDDLLECTVLAKSAMERFIDKVRIPCCPLDVLAQHLVGMSIERKWSVEEAYKLVKRSYPFHNLSFEDFKSVLEYLAGRYGLEEERVYAKLWYDEEEGVFGRKRSARMIYQLNTGTIPDEADVKVVTVDGKYVGNVEEEFAEVLVPGDVFVLSGRTFKFVKSDGTKIVVEPAKDARPTVPSWFSEMLPLSFDSALRVGAFRRRIWELLKKGDYDGAKRTLVEEYLLEDHAASVILEYISLQDRYVGVVPSDKLVLVEYFPDEEKGYWSIVFHTLYGRRVNDALSRLFASKLSDIVDLPVRITVSDNGFMLTLKKKPSKKLLRELLALVLSSDPREVLKKVISRTELMKRRFRHVAQRSFMILRRYKGRERSPERLQLSAQHILKILLDTFPEHPIVRETYREILEDYMDIKNAERVLEWLRAGEVKVEIKGPLSYPSPFAHSLVVRGYSDIVLMEDRKKILALLHKRILEYLGGGASGSSAVTV